MYISIILYIHEVKVPIHPGTHRMFGHLKDWTWPLWSEPLAYRKILTDPFMIQNDRAIVYIYIEGSRLAKELSKKKRMIWCAKPNNKLYLILPFGLLHKLKKKTVFWAYHITQNDAKKQPTSQQLRPTWPRNCREFAEACHKNDAALPLKSLHGTAQIQGCGWWLYWGIWPCLVFAPCWFSGTYGINPLFCSDGELPFPF